MGLLHHLEVIQGVAGRNCRYRIVLQDGLKLHLRAQPEAVRHVGGLVHMEIEQRRLAGQLDELAHQPLEPPPGRPQETALSAGEAVEARGISQATRRVHAPIATGERYLHSFSITGRSVMPPLSACLLSFTVYCTTITISYKSEGQG